MALGILNKIPICNIFHLLKGDYIWPQVSASGLVSNDYVNGFNRDSGNGNGNSHIIIRCIRGYIEIVEKKMVLFNGCSEP